MCAALYVYVFDNTSILKNTEVLTQERYVKQFKVVRDDMHIFT